MGNALHNLQLIKAAIEGLRRLDDWEPSEIKDSLIQTRNSLIIEKKWTAQRFSEYPMYADPWGKEISFFEWAVVYEACNRHIGQDYFKFKDSEIHVSTVWMGLNQSPFGVFKFFETMIFGFEEENCPDLSHYPERYGTLDEALEGHKKACEMVQNFLRTQVAK